LQAADLFDDFAARHARGERPDVREYLERAGEGADELASLIDAFLRAAPRGEPAPETLAMMEAFAEGEPPLLRLRVHRRLTRDAVADALVDGLDLDFRKTPKVRRYYHELETGLLDPARVDARVFSVLAKTLHARVAELVASRPPAFEPSSMYLRDPRADAEPAGPPPFEADGKEPDEVDLLFNPPEDESEGT
jgi:hypothetical protein